MTPIVWPRCLLNPRETAADPVPFSRSGGKSLNGIERVTRTDRGFWSVTLGGIVLRSTEQKRTWNAMRVAASGRAGLFILPVRSWDSAPFESGKFEPGIVLPHSDGTLFSDGTGYEQGNIDVQVAAAVGIGATVIKLRRLLGAADLSGVRFSHEHAAYETGPAIDVDRDVWTVPISPAIRAPITAGTQMEFDNPTCLCRLADDRGLDLAQGKRGFDTMSVAFVEAVDWWNDLAVAA